MSVELNQTVQAQILSELESGFPDEAGGFLFGTMQNGTVTIADAIPVANIFEAEERHHRILLSPQDWDRLDNEAEARGLSLVGYYHSHPNSPAVPSIYDRDHALPNFVYLITSVQEGKAAEMRAWLLRDDRSQFDETGLTVS